MRKYLVLLCGFLFLYTSCTTMPVLQENEKFVVSEIIEYSATDEIISSMKIYYNNDGNAERKVFSQDDNHIIYDGMRYDENNNCIQYFQNNPYILYKMEYNSNQRIIRKDEYSEGKEPPSYSITYFYSFKGEFYGEYHYILKKNKKVLATDIRYDYDVENRLYKETIYSFIKDTSIHYYYIYDDKSRIIRKDIASKWYNLIDAHDEYTYDTIDRLMLIKHYIKEKYTGKTVYKYIKIRIHSDNNNSNFQ